METRIRVNFKSKTYPALIMIWKEYSRNGTVIGGKTLFVLPACEFSDD